MKLPVRPITVIDISIFVFAVISMVLSNSGPVFSQTADSIDSPEAVMAEYVDRYKNDDFLGVAELMNPPELSEFKTAMIEILKTADSNEIKYGWSPYYDKYGFDLTPLFDLDSVQFFAVFLELTKKASSNPNIQEMIANADYKIEDIGTDGDTLCMISYKLLLTTPEGKHQEIPDFLVMKRNNGKWRVKLGKDTRKLADIVKKYRK